MTVHLKLLVEGTMFTLGTQKYKKGGKSWMWKSVKDANAKRDTLDQGIADDTTVVACHPYLGGEYQTNIDVWVPENEGVSVY